MGLFSNVATGERSFAVPRDRLLACVRDAAATMPRWSAVGGDAGVLRFEARTRLVGWVDDVTIEVGEDGGGSRLEIRSASRVGLSDFWANSLRIRAFFRALDSAIRAS